MRTVVVSDLHLGSGEGGDLLRAAAFRGRLLDGLQGADRVVLLGDVVELRDRPVSEALAAAEPFFVELAEALPDAEIVVVPGNHDHHLLFAWAEARRLRGNSRPMGLEQRAKATSGPLRTLARAAGVELAMAYPGIWLRDDVYATHGHYLDAHLTVPTFERLGVGVVERLLGDLPHGGRAPDDYERAQAPLYAFLYALAQSGADGERLGAKPSARVWMALTGGEGALAKLRGLLLGSVALPGAIGVANRLGIGTFRADLSLAEIGRAGVRAMAETVERLEIGSRWVLFGHTHHRGPDRGDEGWTANGGSTRLVNTGSWVYSPGLLGRSPKDSKFWPGRIVVVEGAGDPRPLDLLDEVGHREFRRELR